MTAPADASSGPPADPENEAQKNEERKPGHDDGQDHGFFGWALRKYAPRVVAPYQAAVVRIAVAFTVLLHLLREIPHREQLYGPDGPWGLDLVRPELEDNGAFTVLTWWGSGAWFEFVYFFGIAVAVALLVGWRTRTASVLFMIMWLSLENRNAHAGSAGDNVLHLLAIYLVLVRCGEVWSLDARRRARAAERQQDRQRTQWWTADLTGLVLWGFSGAALAVVTFGGQLGSPVWLTVLWGLWAVHALWRAVQHYAPGEPRTVMEMTGNLAHAAALLIIAFEVCLIYSTAGWYKIQGSYWQDGTAVYYPMNLDTYSPWPELSGLLTGNGGIVFLLTYATVFIQVGFVFALLNRQAKNILLVCVICEHIGIGFLMGLPVFSLAMISADLIFLPTVFLLAVGDRARALTDPLRRRFGPRGTRSDGGNREEGTASSTGEDSGGTPPGPAPEEHETDGQPVAADRSAP